MCVCTLSLRRLAYSNLDVLFLNGRLLLLLLSLFQIYYIYVTFDISPCSHCCQNYFPTGTKKFYCFVFPKRTFDKLARQYQKWPSCFPQLVCLAETALIAFEVRSDLSMKMESPTGSLGLRRRVNMLLVILLLIERNTTNSDEERGTERGTWS